jgi:FixJ family two-component response regulator
VILDVQMPGMDGFGLQQRLVADNRRIPVVFLTAHGDGAARARATRAGVVGFLRKPFDEEALLGVVHSVLTSASSD